MHMARGCPYSCAQLAEQKQRNSDLKLAFVESKKREKELETSEKLLQQQLSQPSNNVSDGEVVANQSGSEALGGETGNDAIKQELAATQVELSKMREKLKRKNAAHLDDMQEVHRLEEALEEALKVSLLQPSAQPAA